MEATADWAAGYVARSGDHGDPAAYANSLIGFLDAPSARLDTFEHPNQFPFPRRQYGAFLFAEYLSEHVGAGGPGQPSYNAAVIHESWEAVGDLPVPQHAAQAFGGVAQAHGTTVAQILSDFNRANYLLDYDDAVAGGASDVEDVWRVNLQNHPPTAGDRTVGTPDGLAPARPSRDRYDISDGQRIEGALTAWYGGATYVDAVPPASTTGTLLVDVAGADATAVDVRVLTLDYRLPPAEPLICEDSQLAIDGSGNGIVAVGIEGGCRYAVVIFTGLFDGVPQPFDWGAQFIATPDQAYCGESFSRTVAPGGWGMSEFGVPWINWTLGPDDPQASVNGTAGVIQGPLDSRLAAENLELSLPIEVLVRWRFIGDGDPVDNYFEVHLQHYDSGRDSSAAYGRDFTGGTDFSKTYANHDGAQSTGTAAVAAPDGQWMWIRQRLTGTETSLRVWQDGQAEPTTWQRSVNGTAFPASPDVITIFANGDEADQGVEVDSITVDVGCVTAAYTDPFDRVVAENSGTSAGWGLGPLGEWRYGARSSAGLWEVNGDEAIHTATEPGTTFASVDIQSVLGLAPRSEVELLVKWRVDTNPQDNVWSFEAYFSDALGITDDYAGVGIAGFSADEAFVNAGITYAAWSDFYNAAPGYPRPMHDKDVWLRLLVDEYGVYARLWEDGQPEPVTTGGVIPSVGGRGEHWHTYEVNEGGIPPMAWRYLELRASGGADTTRVDSVTVILP
ncbi:MAG TPA: hypothetical protein VJ820_20870 [Propionibacteriaceae bacterium]|nr:hypothetical protein [Propionibacteriaceae bacterium]